MRFALIDNKPTEAASGLNGGVCPGCGAPVIAKCGTHKVHHWAHKGVKMCDNWWEPETEWHRAWKNNFPKEWQEIFLPDEQTGEKHIADVKTEHGLVIEFQHSHIKPEERISREKFYRNMVWIVDGTRLKYDLPRFLKGGKFGAIQLKPGIMHVEFADDFFHATGSKVLFLSCSIFMVLAIQTVRKTYDTICFAFSQAMMILKLYMQ